MSQLQVQVAPLEMLQGLLPKLLQNVSLSRAQIAIDQLRGVIQSAGTDRIVLITGCRAECPDEPLAAAIAIQQPPADGQTATIIHAGPTEIPSEEERPAWIESLATAMDKQLRQRGVGFVQWATDVEGDAVESVVDWCRGFGFQAVGTLEYLSGEVPADAANDANRSKPSKLRLMPVDVANESDLQSFTELVERTYHDTLDCPELAVYRSAAQTLRGYQVSDAFDRDAWFRVLVGDENGPTKECGCLILATHRPPEDQETGEAVTELVYMGLLPDARGNGYGTSIVEQALQAARHAEASRLILAVDQNNHPARTIYQSAGLAPMLRETVWVKRLDR